MSALTHRRMLAEIRNWEEYAFRLGYDPSEDWPTADVLEAADRLASALRRWECAGSSPMRDEEVLP